MQCCMPLQRGLRNMLIFAMPFANRLPISWSDPRKNSSFVRRIVERYQGAKTKNVPKNANAHQQFLGVWNPMAPFKSHLAPLLRDRARIPKSWKADHVVFVFPDGRAIYGPWLLVRFTQNKEYLVNLFHTYAPPQPKVALRRNVGKDIKWCYFGVLLPC